MSFWKNLFAPKITKKCQCEPVCECNPCQCGTKKMMHLLHLTPDDQTILKNIDQRIVIGKVRTVESHPDPAITKVQVTKTDIGEGKEVQILCGGTNVREGIVVAVATLGTVFSQDFKIEVRSIRGQKSEGMICARSELGFSKAEEQKGEIWVLPTELEKKIGTPLKQV
jgi:tRNA-binding EMAP/Myf-like protein